MYKRHRNETEEEMNFRAAVHEFIKDSPLKDGQDVNAVMKKMLAVILEDGLEGELEESLGYERYDSKNKNTDNSRNGHYEKNVHTSYGDTKINVPRDRTAEFEPQLLPKFKSALSHEIEDKIISMYAKGMSTSDIEEHVRELYGVQISDSTVSRITDKVLSDVSQWQNRLLEELYAVVFLDAVYFNVKSEGRVVKKALYVAIGIDMEGMQDILGLYVGDNESSKFWLGILNDIKNRGVEDIFICCVDGLSGFPSAIEAVYPKCEIQRCIIHQIRSSTRFVSYKDIKELMQDLKEIYRALNESAAIEALDEFSEKWDKKYPLISKSWRENWVQLSTYFKYPPEIRTLIYTTNRIENFNRQLRKVTKNRSSFPSDDALIKLVYLATLDQMKKWSRLHNWGVIHSQLVIYFEDRL